MSAEIKPHDAEMVSVLFVDIVGHTLHAMEQQNARLNLLSKIASESANRVLEQSPDKLITIPAGDGMALVFFRNPVMPAMCALEISNALRSHPEIEVRMGVHIGPVMRHLDIKDQVNVLGSGINTAQRIMDCGDAGHILVSHSVAEVLDQFKQWRECIQDLGMHEVKHGERVHLYNLCKDGLGNPETPRKIRVTVELPPPASAAPAKIETAFPWRWLGIVLLAVALAAGLILLRNRGIAPEAQQPPAPASADLSSTAPTNPAETVTVADASQFYVTLEDDVRPDALDGQTVNFTVRDDFKAGESVVIAKGAKAVGSVIRAKRTLGMFGRKITFRLMQAQASDGKELNIRATPKHAGKGPDSRSFDTGTGSKSKDLAAAKGTEYLAYIDGDQTVAIRK